MKLNRELSQRCWLEVMRFAQDDSFGCRQLIRYCPFITSTFNFLDALAPRRDCSRGRCALRRKLSQQAGRTIVGDADNLFGIVHFYFNEA